MGVALIVEVLVLVDGDLDRVVQRRVAPTGAGALVALVVLADWSRAGVIVSGSLLVAAGE